MKETDRFLSDVGGDRLIEDAPIPGDKEEDAIPDELKNRQIKRLLKRRDEDKLATRELAENLSKMSEKLEYLEKDRKGSLKYSERLEKVIGNDTPEKRALAAEMSRILEETEENSAKRAEEASRSASKKDAAEQASLDRLVEDRISDVEDKFSIDLTSGSAESEERYEKFMSLLKKMSPKDKQGNLTDYADFDAVAEIFKEQQSKGSSINRKKEIASRGASQSTSADTTKSELSVHEQWLKRNGILPSDFKKYT